MDLYQTPPNPSCSQYLLTQQFGLNMGQHKSSLVLNISPFETKKIALYAFQVFVCISLVGTFSRSSKTGSGFWTAEKGGIDLFIYSLFFFSLT